MKLSALAPLVFCGVSLLAGASSAQVRVAPVGPPINRAPVAPAPAALGWPHSFLSGNGSGCLRNPEPNEVIVFRDGNFSGACAALLPGFYPYATSFLVGNDAISSLKVGSNVRVRIYRDAGYAGDWTIFQPNTQMAGLGSFDDVISSIRVDPGNRRATCDDLVEGEIALFEGYAGQGDCVVLPGDGIYPSADSMGIANDTISSIRNNSSHSLSAYWNASFNMLAFTMPPHNRIEALRGKNGNAQGPDNNISSIQMF